MLDLLNTKYHEGDYNDGDLWQKISQLDCSDLPCMDISLNLIDEDDYYGVNFTNNKKVYMLFYTGSTDYFSGIWIGNDNIDFLDSMSIYIFDLSVSNENIIEPIGNFRYHIEKLLNDFFQYYKKMISIQKQLY